MIRTLLSIICTLFVSSSYAHTSLERLMGTIDATYQVRTDILLYINNSAPLFSKPWKALLKIAQNQNFLYYHARTYEEAENTVKETSVAQRCLNLEYNEGIGYSHFKKIEEMMGDTKERQEHIFEVSNYFFGRRGFSHLKINKADLEYRCDSGNYG